MIGSPHILHAMIRGYLVRNSADLEATILEHQVEDIRKFVFSGIPEEDLDPPPLKKEQIVVVDFESLLGSMIIDRWKIENLLGVDQFSKKRELPPLKINSKSTIPPNNHRVIIISFEEAFVFTLNQINSEPINRDRILAGKIFDSMTNMSYVEINKIYLNFMLTILLILKENHYITGFNHVNNSTIRARVAIKEKLI
jgi:hypothetical protein